MSKIQDFFSSGSSRVNIPKGEYEGPLTIRHACEVDGHGATLWAKIGAALIIEASNVTIKNLRVELVSSTKNKDFIAIDVRGNGVRLENVEVYGNIRGLQNVSPCWELPRSIDLGTFAANESNEFEIRCEVAEPCRILNSVYGLTVKPQNLSAGENTLRLSLERMKDGIILYGSLILETGDKILRRIYLSGRAQKGASTKHPELSFVPPKSQNQSRTPSKPQTQSRTPSKPQTQSRTSPKPQTQSRTPPKPQTQSRTSPKPQTQSWTPPKPQIQSKDFPCSFEVSAEVVQLSFEAERLTRNMSIDAFAFCLGSNGKVRRDGDVVFFNNPVHESFGIYLTKNVASSVTVDFKNVPAEIKSIVICFAICDAGNRLENNFSKAISPKLIARTGENDCREFPLQLIREKVLKAFEFRRNAKKWRALLIGKGFAADLRDFCTTYGVETF